MEKLKMRVERSGLVTPLTPRIVSFLKERLGGVSLDEQGDIAERPDFTCLKGLVAIEIKSLETDPTERLVNALAPEIESDEWPAFYGTWPIQSIIGNLPNGEDLQAKLLNRLGRTVVRVVKKASDQLNQHAAQVKRRNLVRLLFLLNEDHKEYDPSTITYVVQRELGRRVEDGSYRNVGIDAVIYLSDRHVATVGSAIYLPALVIFGPNLEDQPWKIEVINLVLRRWARWNGVPLLPEGTVSLDDIVTAEHVPDTMKLHESWALDYRRRPSMKSWKDEDLRNLWDHVMLLSLLWGHVGSPMSVPQDGYMMCVEKFTHLMQEVATRGLPLKYFAHDHVRLGRAIDGLNYGPVVASWLRSIVLHQSDYAPHPRQIEGARWGYEAWWAALGWVREGLIEGRMLRDVEVTAAMPKRRPW